MDESTFDYARFNSLDEIAEYPDADAIVVAGLRQNDFNRFVTEFARQFKIIHFWKCPYVSDLSLLGTLQDVEYITYFWNQRSSAFWDMKNNASLVGLELECFSRMHDLGEIVTAPALMELVLDSGIALGNYSIASLWPLAKSRTLKMLSFNTCVTDNDPMALLHIPSLKHLFFPPNMFSTDVIAMLTAKLSDVECSSFAPYIDYGGETKKSVCIVGKGKPWLDPIKDDARIKKYVKEFGIFVDKYRNEQ